MPNSSQPRQFSPYELNHLRKYGLATDPGSLVNYGTTPVEYVTGKVTFANLELTVNRHTLIPRVETEDLLNLISANIPDTPHSSILEVGTGSGAILLGLLARLHQEGNTMPCRALGTDLSPQALAVAQLNATHLNLDPTLEVSWLQSDLLEKIAPQKFDLVIANLPYIPSNRLPSLDPSVVDHEPHLALDGGPDGWRIIDRLLNQLPRYLSANHQIWLEVDDTHDQAFLDQHLHDYQSTIYQDFAGKNRFIELKLIAS